MDFAERLFVAGVILIGLIAVGLLNTGLIQGSEVGDQYDQTAGACRAHRLR